MSDRSKGDREEKKGSDVKRAKEFLLAALLTNMKSYETKIFRFQFNLSNNLLRFVIQTKI